MALMCGWKTWELKAEHMRSGRKCHLGQLVLFVLSFGCTVWNAGSWFPYHGSNPGPVQGKHSLNHWTSRKFPSNLLLKRQWLI